MAQMFTHTMKMKVSVSKDELLAALRVNRERHGKIFTEAREGYIKRAKVAIERRMEELREGRLVSLDFHLAVPTDYTAAYDTAIRMLELHQDKTIELSAEEVRCLVMDEWDWLGNFLAINKAYSNMANDYATSKGL